jgi:hypothetical protein
MAENCMGTSTKLIAEPFEEVVGPVFPALVLLHRAKELLLWFPELLRFCHVPICSVPKSFFLSQLIVEKKDT